MISVLHIWVSASRQQRNIVQQCTRLVHKHLRHNCPTFIWFCPNWPHPWQGVQVPQAASDHFSKSISTAEEEKTCTPWVIVAWRRIIAEGNQQLLVSNWSIWLFEGFRERGKSAMLGAIGLPRSSLTHRWCFWFQFGASGSLKNWPIHRYVGSLGAIGLPPSSLSHMWCDTAAWVMVAFNGGRRG